MNLNQSTARLTDATKRYVRHMELDDLAAMKVCLLSTGALLGLSCKGKLTRRLAGLTCSFLAAGLAIPLTNKFLDELKPEDPILVGSLPQETPEAEPLSPSSEEPPAEEPPHTFQETL